MSLKIRWRQGICLIAALFGFVRGVQVTDITDDPAVTVSRGAHVTPVPDVLLYTENEFLLFMIPVFRDPPAVSAASCKIDDDEACALFDGMQSGVEDITKMLRIVNRMLTTKGLNDVDPRDVEIPTTWLNIIKGVNVASNGPSPEMVTAAGDDWVSDMEARLTLRGILVNDTDSVSKRGKRWIKQVIGAGLSLAPHVLNGDIVEVFKKLFVGDKSILSYITQYKVFSKKAYKYFADLPKRVSELQAETKQLLLDVLNSTEAVKSVTKEIQEDIKDHNYKLATIEEAFILEQNTVSDIIRSLYTTVVYTVHLAAYDECRSNKLPVAFVPPQLLRRRLMDIEKNLPDHLRLVIPMEEIQRYFQLPLAECVFDSNGGIIRMSVPLIEKSSNFQLFEYKPLHFGYGKFTCAVETLSSFLIKDVKNNRIFSVTEVDEEFCLPRTSGLCKIPFSAADDSNNFCISVLLSGEPAHVIKDTCNMRCFPDDTPSVSQIMEDVFIGVHLPPNGVRMECPNEVLNMNTVVDHGSVRFRTVCNCKIFVGNKLMGKSSAKYCDDTLRPIVDVILPVQMTTFNDLMPFSDDGLDNTVFSHAEEILNRQFQTGSDSNEVDLIETPLRIINVIWDMLQSLTLAYLYFRINRIVGTLIALGNNFQLVQASPQHTCVLPMEAFILLWSTLIICTLSTLPKVVMPIYRMLKRMYNEHIDLVARRYAFDEAGNV